jgi:hypothetical protein
MSDFQTSDEGHVEIPALCVGGSAATIVVGVIPDGDGRMPELAPRSADDDMRIALHEIGGHALVSVLLDSPLGGVSCEPADSDGHSGLCWGPTFRSRLAGGPEAPELCEQIGQLMPGPGESRTEVADIFLHVHTRVVELVAGSVAEAMYLHGEPWDAVDDRRQERVYASLICSSPEAVEAFVNFCIVEAAALLAPREHIVRALTAELLIRRTMTGAEVEKSIRQAVAVKAAEVERQRRLDWKRIEESAALFEASFVGARAAC